MKTHRNAWQRPICRISFIAAIVLHMANITTTGQVRNDSLPEVQIISTRYQVPAIEQPQQVMVITSDMLESTSARDLVSLLSLYGHAYLRSNGPGLAAGLTQRGFGTTSFQIVRDGFALNQHMHGQVDMALIPVASLGFAEIATANASSTFGSAASGGSLLLGNSWKQGWSLSHEAGPWGFRETAGSIVGQLGRATLSANGGITASDNDYRYEAPESRSVLRRENSSLDRKWLNVGSLLSTEGYVLRTNIYAHEADRGIPDPINFLGTQGVQSDEEIRLTAELSGPADNSRWSVSGQFWQSRLLYDDNWLTETSYNRVRGVSASTQRAFDVTPTVALSAVAGGEVVAVETNNYESPTSRNSLQGSMRGLIRLPSGVRMFPAVRIDIIEDVGTALSPSFGMNKAILKDVLHLRSQWSYNFTAPTLNDQFWNFGGNPDLNAERAHKADVGIHYNVNVGSTDFDWQVQAFVTRAKNGIIWQPGDNDIWSPVNLQKLHGHGIEQALRLSTQVGLFGVSFGTQATWNRAYIPEPRFDGDVAMDKQLRYTPEWMLRFQGGLTHRSVSLNAEVAHDGKRFTSEDHGSSVDPLPAYTVANLGIQLRMAIAGVEPSIRLNLNNAFDAKYSTIAWYPMPGRHLLLSLKVRKK
jgi:iron complex outermembrane receptor protein